MRSINHHLKLPKDGWPEWLFVLVIDTGLPGALVVLSFGQLMPQLVAATLSWVS